LVAHIPLPAAAPTGALAPSSLVMTPPEPAAPTPSHHTQPLRPAAPPPPPPCAPLHTTPTSLRRHSGPVQRKHYHRCPAAEVRTLITPRGLYVCAHQRSHPLTRLGDAVTDRPRTIWQG
ncbi:hypothetical protein VM98_35240, partial [Streptomyces rubellomurinus subsp. indigoferus]